jgi:hypothetical protein
MICHSSSCYVLDGGGGGTLSRIHYDHISLNVFVITICWCTSKMIMLDKGIRY